MEEVLKVFENKKSEFLSVNNVAKKLGKTYNETIRPILALTEYGNLTRDKNMYKFKSGFN